MFPQFKKLNNESGLVLFMVLMVAIIIMIFSAGILMQSLNEVNYTQQQIDQIVSGELSKGIFWNAYSNGTLSSLPAGSSLQATSSVGGTPYQVTLHANGGTAYSVTSNYGYFQ